MKPGLTCLPVVFALTVSGQSKKASTKVPAAPAGIAWTQWGGPNRNFTTQATGLADSWPATGPKVLWKRTLGEGYSSLLVEGGTIYTLYGRPGEEVVLAADARTGKTQWEHATPVTFRSAYEEPGIGPHASGLIVGDRLFTVGVTGRLQCLDKKTGKVIWSHNLWLDLKGSRLDYGYASSPLAFRSTIIVPVGGNDSALAAFEQADGKLVWKKGTAGNAYSSPVLINVGGLEQAAVLMNGTVFAVNPHNGDLQWSAKHVADYGINVATPLWLPGNLLFVTAAYGAGSRVLELTREGNKTTRKELWHSNKLRIHHGNAQLIHGVLYFSNGDKGPAPMTAVQLKTGEILWQDRAFGKSTLLAADGKLIVLDTDGDLALARPNAKGLNVLARHSLLQTNAWTPPTLVGTTLYIRDRRNMMAVELGKL